jgi:hypothetical protein
MKIILKNLMKWILYILGVIFIYRFVTFLSIGELRFSVFILICFIIILIEYPKKDKN